MLFSIILQHANYCVEFYANVFLTWVSIFVDNSRNNNDVILKLLEHLEKGCIILLSNNWHSYLRVNTQIRMESVTMYREI